MKEIKRALCLSGGGSKGAWAGGLVQQFIEERGYDWDMYFGTSTGSLLNTLIPLKDMKRLKEAYTNVTNKNIFSVDPFTKRGKLNIFNAIWRIINSKTSLGESGGLEKILKSMFSPDDFYNIRKLDKHVWSCVSDYTHNQVQYGYNQNLTYDEYIKYTLASTSVPLAMNLVTVNGSDHLDGGVLMHVPIQKAIDEGADEVDVIILRPEKIDTTEWRPKNILDVMLRTIDIMQEHISEANVLIAQLNAGKKDVKLRIRYTPYKLTDNSLMFDKELMLKWWDEGYEFGRKENQSHKVILKSTDKRKW
jgi:predicted patatin/cPLA2 family phospholipase